METSQAPWVTSVVFEHACKEDFKEILKNIFGNEDLISKVQESVTASIPSKPKINPVFFLIHVLKKLSFCEKFAPKPGNAVVMNMLPILLDLLDSTYRQYNFMSLKRYLTLISELKLLDLLNLIVNDSESQLVIQKLNQHFPRWTPVCRSAIENDFNIENSKILDKVEESHSQCRRLILKLAVDKAYKLKYMSEHHSSDMNRLVNESKSYLTEAVTALELFAGPSVLEKMVSGKEPDIPTTDDLCTQLLLDYVQPKITDENLLKFLEDLEPLRNSQPTSGLTSCLLPFDTMSDASEDESRDSEQSDSEYESSEDIADPAKLTRNTLPQSPEKISDALMDIDKD